jgi:S-adenosylmethionine:tRNA ribosyltransferase-isomerase
MLIQELQYDLPPELIAQRPAEPRDASRLLVLDRATGHMEHRRFSDVSAFLRPGDVLVLNDTRVIPARFFCRRQTGGRIEGLFLRDAGNAWRVLLKPSGRLQVGEKLACLDGKVELLLIERHPRGEWQVGPEPPTPWLELLERVGQTPLPPYIRPDSAGRAGAPDASDRERYQTVYAERPGAVAAPTAGLHFTPALLRMIAQRGAKLARVTLHVGLGTFAPIDVEDLSEHKMHSEWFEIRDEALATIRAARAAGGRIIAVGTTAVRVLESVPALESSGHCGWTKIFIYPPYRFRHVDALMTNFHMPGSTLLALVMAFASPEQIRSAYRQAIERRYRFYSYGDAMLIL